MESMKLANIEEVLDGYLRAGWRLDIKTHAFMRMPWDFLPPEGGLDPTDKVGWVVDATPWAHPKGITQRIIGGTSESLTDALLYTMRKTV